MRNLSIINHYERFLNLDAKLVLPQRDNTKSKYVQGLEHISKICKEKRNTEILQCLIANFQSLYSYYFIFDKENCKEKTQEHYQQIRNYMLQKIKIYMTEFYPKFVDLFVEKFNQIEHELYESLTYCISEFSNQV